MNADPGEPEEGADSLLTERQLKVLQLRSEGALSRMLLISSEPRAPTSASWRRGLIRTSCALRGPSGSG